jgi:uncharacterized protein YwqG
MARDIYKWLFGARGRDAVTAPLPPLPDVLAPHAEAIAATVLPIVGVEVLDGPPAKPAGSRLGGRPWWPRGRPYPRAADGAPLFLLIQVDFAETPDLQPFPRQGLLQLFIAQGDLYGANLDDPTKSTGFACVYHADTRLPLDTSLVLPALGENGYLPLESPLESRALVLRTDRMTIDPSDYRFERLLPAIAVPSRRWWESEGGVISG